jgi:hypothetical protein
MTPLSQRQGELFAAGDALSGLTGPAPLPPPLLRGQLLEWQERLRRHQGPLFRGQAGGVAQASLFAATESQDPLQRAGALNPLMLQPQSLSFWRWPEAPHRGAAVYLVIDRPDPGADPLLLYVGETGCADRRWKGDHDCKRYLSAYGEALRKAALPMALSIRFWCDVPAATASRRSLEQALIRRWLPPFNKETRERWATPFTADPD